MCMDEMKGVSAVRVHFRYWGRSFSNERVPMGMFRDKLQFGNYVELRARLLLYKQPYIQSETNTRICATSATNATSYHTCLLDKSYVLVHCPIHCIHSPPSEVLSGQVHQSQGFWIRNPLSTLPYPYSEHAYHSSESVCNIEHSKETEI